ncbi:MAG: hypothetical protein IPM54_37320 [Polyangiaceae bacterium]|nr:hypothetical protein [Polyangiaceae bacterium]
MTGTRLRIRACILGLALAELAMATPAFAQTGMPPGGVAGPPPGGGQSKPSQAQPETHAASGADEVSPLQTQEPTLPQEPLEIPKEVAGQIGSSAAAVPKYAPSPVDRDFYGLWYSERGPNHQFRTLFPLWAEWQKPKDRASLITPFYYRRRAPDYEADVLFPLYWRFREKQTRTTVVGPFMHQEREATAKRPAGHTNWLPPLFFEGRSGSSGYLHIPPLLMFTKHTDHDGLNVVGPLYCRWKGGPACDARTADDIDMGLAPLYFYGRNETREYEIIPPLLHYYRYSDVGESWTNVWGPYIRTHDKDGDSRHIAPFYWHWWGKNKESITVAPFFHYSYEGNASRVATPLFYWSRNEEGHRTFASWVYAHHQGRTELQMISPLYWHYRDPDIGLDRKMLFPFLYKEESPRGKDLVVFPFYGRFQRHGLSDETWVTPLFRYRTDTSGWQANLFPFFHMGRTYNSTHLVLAPFVWDFASPTSRATIILPGFFRFADADGVSQLALNTFYRERKVEGGTDWEFHFFPFFSFGNSPVGHWWNVLYGLAGYTREGAMSKMRLLYIPITLSKDRRPD